MAVRMHSEQARAQTPQQRAREKGGGGKQAARGSHLIGPSSLDGSRSRNRWCAEWFFVWYDGDGGRSPTSTSAAFPVSQVSTST